ncbi:MAG: ribonuclease E activity regulator RraA [Flavobacteriales bacterium]|nr:ribonuclease E activity regulator RraA [Flavobacteriales bacterium]
MPQATADLCDKHIDRLQVLDPMLTDFGGFGLFEGEIHTLKVFEDNSLVRTALEKDGTGKVLVIDGGGSFRCALVGDQLAALAVEHNWRGMIVYGCVRDIRMMMEMELGIKALASTPVKSIKRNEGQENITVRFGGVDFIPGHYLYADEDGVVVAECPLI